MCLVHEGVYFFIYCCLSLIVVNLISCSHPAFWKTGGLHAHYKPNDSTLMKKL